MFKRCFHCWICVKKPYSNSAGLHYKWGFLLMVVVLLVVLLVVLFAGGGAGQHYKWGFLRVLWCCNWGSATPFCVVSGKGCFHFLLM